MKTYLIKNTAIMHNGKIFPEGSTIELDEQEALQLSNYLEESTVNFTLSVSSRAESRDEGSSLTNNKEQNTKNNKRSK